MPFEHGQALKLRAPEVEKATPRVAFLFTCRDTCAHPALPITVIETMHASTTPGFTGHTIPVTNERSPNVTRTFDGFHLSYDRSSRDYGCDTTAFVIQGRLFLVLNGNHCAAMVSAAENGIQGVVDYFIEHIGQANERSEHRMAAGIDTDPFALAPTMLKMVGQESIDRIAQAEADLALARAQARQERPAQRT